jgi:hypothetical protein
MTCLVKMVARIAFRIGIVVAAGYAVSTVGCAPQPRSVRCSNGGECKERDAKFEYCLEGRCVECVANGSCGMNRTCADGACVVEKAE